MTKSTIALHLISSGSRSPVIVGESSWQGFKLLATSAFAPSDLPTPAPDSEKESLKTSIPVPEVSPPLRQWFLLWAGRARPCPCLLLSSLHWDFPLARRPGASHL